MSVPQPVSRITNWLELIRVAVGECASVCFPVRQRKSAVSRALPFEHAAAGLPVGSPVPDFTLPRVGGGKCSVDQYRGKRVLLFFVDPGSHGSREASDDLNRLQRSTDISVLAISRSRKEAALWADEVEAAFPVLVDSTGDVAAACNVSTLPATVSLDEQGRVAESALPVRKRVPRLLSRLIPAISTAG